MNATLKFNLPEDQSEFENAVNGGKWKHAMWKMDQWLRSRIKYAPDSQSGEYTNALVVAREELMGILEENNLELE